MELGTDDTDQMANQKLALNSFNKFKNGHRPKGSHSSAPQPDVRTLLFVMSGYLSQIKFKALGDGSDSFLSGVILSFETLFFDILQY